MGLLRKVLAGLAMGAGNALVAKAEMDWKAAQAEILQRREIALENLKHQNALALQDNATANQKEVISHTGTEQRITDKNRGQVEAEVGEKTDNRRFAQTKQLKELEGQQSISLEKLRGRNQRELAKLEQQYESGEIVDVKQGTSGQYYGLTRAGVWKPSGIKGNIPESADGITTGAGGSGIDAYRPGGAKPAAPSSEEKTKPEFNEAVFRTRYVNATEATAPGLFRNGKKIPMDEARRMMLGQ